MEKISGVPNTFLQILLVQVLLLFLFRMDTTITKVSEPLGRYILILIENLPY